MFNKKFRKFWIILLVVALTTAFFVVLRNDQAQKKNPVAVAGEKVTGDIQQNKTKDEELLAGDTASDKAQDNVTLIDNSYFHAQVGTYWVFEGQSHELVENKVENKKIKIKHEVVSISGKADDYLITIKTTDMIDKSVKDGTTIIKKDYVIFNTDYFYNYVKFPLKVGSRWAEGLDSDPTEKLRDDGFYQNRINWKLKEKILGNDCYNIIEQTLPDKVETIWCENIGPIQNTYHHNGSLNDIFLKLIKYHF